MFSKKTEKWKPIARYVPKPGDRFLHKKDRFGIADIQALAYDLVAWSKRDDAFTYQEWLGSYCITFTDYTNWQLTYPSFKAAVDLAKSNIGTRRELMAAKGELNPQLIGKYLPYWNQGYKAHVEWESKLRNLDVIENNGQKIVVMEKFPTTDIPECGSERAREPYSPGKVPTKAVPDADSGCTGE